MQEVYIVGSKRTPIGSFLGSLSGVSATELGATAVKAAMAEAGITGDQVCELFFGSVLSANLGQAPAQQVARFAGIAESAPCTLINKVCASGTKAIMIGAQSIRLGDADIVVAGGMENMSLVPHYVPFYRSGFKYGNTELIDGIVRDALQDVYSKSMMGMAGELCAETHGITRAMQDEYCVRSYNLAIEAAKSGFFAKEITPVKIVSKKAEIIVDKDEEPGNVKFDKIATLASAFKKDGTITAANASKINDGAAAVVLAGENAVKKYNLKPLARIVSYGDANLAPEWFTIAPSKSIPLAAQKGGLNLDQIDLFEINEAFSVVALINQRLLNVPMDKINVNGGAVALGHPVGCSGARLAITLTNALKQRNKKYGAIGICNGGGGAASLILENV